MLTAALCLLSGTFGLTSAVFTGSTSTVGAAATQASFDCGPGYSDNVLNTNGLLNYWRLGETSGTAAVDLKSGSNGTYTGVVALNQPAARQTMAGNPSVGLNGTGNVLGPNINSFNGTANYTVEAWVMRNGPSSGYDRIITKEDAGASPRNGWEVFLKPTAEGYSVATSRWTAGTSVEAVGTTDLELSRWYHVAVTYTGSVLSVFVDGNLEATNNTTTALNSTTWPLNIGASGSGNIGRFNGSIDEVSIYGTALTQSAIQAHRDGCLLAGTATPLVSVSGTHACRVAADRTAWCWGANTNGQMGNGTTGTAQLVPVQVAGNHRWLTVSAGPNWTCGVTVRNAGYCWGINTSSQHGNGTTNPSTTPVPVLGGHSWANILAPVGNGTTTCGVRTDSKAYCWGTNSAGEMGDGSANGTVRNTPVAVGPAINFAMISVSTNLVCGVSTTNVGYCWGDNTNGKIGNGNTTPQASPVISQNGTSFKQISAPQGGAPCGIRVDDTAICWGNNSNGAFGNGTNTGAGSTPVVVGGNKTWAWIAGGGSSTCGIEKPTSLMWCWGSNAAGQLGDGGTTAHYNPAVVNGGFTYNYMIQSFDTICASQINGLDKCWGNNANGKTGNGNTTTPQTSPVNAFSNVTVSVGAASIVEGTNSRRELSVPVTLSAPQNEDVTFTYSLSPGTAAANSDYVPIAGTGRIFAGSQLTWVAVPVVADAVVESDETLTLTISSPRANASIGTASATGTLVNDD